MIEDKATRYHRLKRQTQLLSLGASAATLLLLLVTGTSTALVRIASGIAPSYAAWPFTVAADVLLLLFLLGLVGLPFDFYGTFVLERRYGLSTQRFGRWVADQAKATMLAWLVASLGVFVVYTLIRRDPVGWWLPTGVALVVALIGLARLAPVLLLPFFYTVKPLSRESLNVRLLSLASQAGTRVLGVYEWGLGQQTRKANAALTGLGATRRILVSDTMLADYSDDEIEVVLAHELAHHVHGDIWRALAIESGLIMFGAFLASRILPLGVGWFGLSSPADLAGLPLLLLVASSVSLLVLPAAHAMSRANERRADRYALTLTRNPAAFISAMKRLGAQHLAEEEPSTLVRWLFYSHPPIAERIAAARQHQT